MSITISCDAKPDPGLRLSCGTFNEVRALIPPLVSHELVAYMDGIASGRNPEIENKLIRDGKASRAVLDFLAMSDVEGEIDADACRELLAATDGWDRRVWPQDFRTTCLVGYLRDFREILRAAADTDSSVSWI